MMPKLGLKTLLESIQQDYLEAKQRPLKDDPVAKRIRHGLDEVVGSDLLGNVVTTMGSAGQGRWATVPWMGIFDPDISVSASHGFYLVYLFSEDMERVYLSLHQAWTFYDKTYQKTALSAVQQVSDYWRRNIKASSPRISENKIQLVPKKERVNSSLPRGYELCNILSISYQRGQIPAEEVLRSDLALMILALEELKSKLPIKNDAEGSIRQIVSGDDTLKATGDYYSVTPRQPRQPRLVTSKRDYAAQTNQDLEVGRLGEKQVVAYEQAQLADFPELQQKVTQVSDTVGDGLGYDVLSFDRQGREKHIEVKTTTQDENTPFFMSANERQYAEHHAETYELFRVFNFDAQRLTGHFYILKGSLEDHCDFKPTNYQVTVNKNGQGSVSFLP